MCRPIITFGELEIFLYRTAALLFLLQHHHIIPPWNSKFKRVIYIPDGIYYYNRRQWMWYFDSAFVPDDLINTSSRYPLY